MRFPSRFLDDIKARLPVSQVVGKFVTLKKQGREWRGLSPFTSEKTPSFFVNDQKMRWFDFSAGKNGNIFDFLIETQGLSFTESVERLAGEAGLSMPTLTPQDIEREQKRAGAAEALEAAARFFEAELQKPSGARARGYLGDRGLGPALQQEFRIGYAPPERFALRDALAAKGFDREIMIEAGLLIHGEEIKIPYDRFRDRVMFPIADASGGMIAFGGRALDKDAQAKYLNSPETVMFHKGATLYNHHRARIAAHKSDRVIAVEGYVDVIAMHSAGFADTVAPLGTALTLEQCELLWRMSAAPILCFDGDRAGRKAAHRAVETALPYLGRGRTLRFAFLPDGQDPDDLVRSAGARGVNMILEKLRSLADVLWMREFEAHQPLDLPEQRAAFERGVLDALNPISDEILRRHYKQDFRRRLWQEFGQSQRHQGRQESAQRRYFSPQAVRGGAMFGAPLTPASPSLINSSIFSQTRQSVSLREAFILLIMLNHSSLIADYAESLSEIEFVNPAYSELRNAILDFVVEENPFFDLRTLLCESGFEPLLQRLDNLVGISSVWSIQPDASAADAEESLKQALALYRKTAALQKDLIAAEAALANDPSNHNLAQLRDLKAQIAALEGVEAMIEGFGVASGRLLKPV